MPGYLLRLHCKWCHLLCTMRRIGNSNVEEPQLSSRILTFTPIALTCVAGGQANTLGSARSSLAAAGSAVEARVGIGGRSQGGAGAVADMRANDEVPPAALAESVTRRFSCPLPPHVHRALALERV